MSDQTQAVRRARNHAAWLGPIVALIGLLSYFTLFVRFPSLRDTAWLNLTIVAVALIVAGYGLRRGFAPPARVGARVAASLGFVATSLFTVLLVAYVFVISSLVPEPTSVALGLERLPAITLAAHDGSNVDLGAPRSRRILLVFYRGYW